jgi:hypothetical protein
MLEHGRMIKCTGKEHSLGLMVKSMLEMCKDGVRHGQGTPTDDEGTNWTGEWENDKLK